MTTPSNQDTADQSQQVEKSLLKIDETAAQYRIADLKEEGLYLSKEL